MTNGLVLGLSFVAILFILLMTFLRFNQEKLFFFPEALPQEYVFPFEHSFEEVFIDAEDGARLHALHFKTENPRGVVLYFHGNAGSLRNWGTLADVFVGRGYDLFMPDYRTYGKSTGNLSEQALHADARQAFNYLLQHYKEQEIVVLGRSIGTGIAVKLASETHPRLLILETPFFHFADLARRHFPFLPVGLLLRYTFRSDAWIAEVKCPVYIFHGTADTIIPYESALELAKKAQVKTEIITIPGGGHNNLNAYPLYHRELDRALEVQ